MQLEKISANFSFAIRVNLVHPGPSSFLFGLFLPLFILWCLSTLANYYFKELVDYQLEVDKGKLTAVANLKS